MTPDEFTAKWRKAELSERSASQQHFLGLCALVEHPAPADIDPTGESFTCEKGAAKADGGDNWADLWKKGFFAWEHKGKRKNLAAAYEQLLRYREDLENPPLLIVCDMDRFSIHTNVSWPRRPWFTSSASTLWRNRTTWKSCGPSSTRPTNCAPGSPARPNSDVIVPRGNGVDLTQRPRETWVVDFGADMPPVRTALYWRLTS